MNEKYEIKKNDSPKVKNPVRQEVGEVYYEGLLWLKVLMVNNTTHIVICPHPTNEWWGEIPYEEAIEVLEEVQKQFS